MGSRKVYGLHRPTLQVLFSIFFLNSTFASFHSSPAQPRLVIDNCVKCIFAIGNRVDRPPSDREDSSVWSQSSLEPTAQAQNQLLLGVFMFFFFFWHQPSQLTSMKASLDYSKSFLSHFDPLWFPSLCRVMHLSECVWECARVCAVSAMAQ